MAKIFTGYPPIQVLLSQMTPDYFFAHNNRDANSWSEGNPLVPSLASLSTSSFSGIPRCPGIHTKVTLFHLVLLALAHTHQSQFGDSFCKCCYCCPFITADMYSRSRYVLSQWEFCAPQDCHQFILKHCREATHRNTLPVVVP